MIETGGNEGYQFKTHPNIDKGLYAQNVLGLKDAERPFPTGSALPILKWRMQVGAPARPAASPSCSTGCALEVCKLAGGMRGRVEFHSILSGVTA